MIPEFGKAHHTEIEQIVQAFLEHGIVVLRDVYDTADIQGCRAKIEPGLQLVAESGLGAGGDAMEMFAHVQSRCAKRFDMSCKPDFEPFREAAGKELVLNLIHALLGDDAVFNFEGCVISLPGAPAQAPHVDGPHKNEGEEEHLGPHLLNVFIPLLDQTMETGATAFAPGSHRLRFPPPRDAYEVALLGVGDAAVFDYRIWHYGMANQAQLLRPLAYCTWSREGDEDTKNFGDDCPIQPLFDSF